MILYRTSRTVESSYTAAYCKSWKQCGEANSGSERSCLQTLAKPISDWKPIPQIAIILQYICTIYTTSRSLFTRSNSCKVTLKIRRYHTFAHCATLESVAPFTPHDLCFVLPTLLSFPSLLQQTSLCANQTTYLVSPALQQDIVDFRDRMRLIEDNSASRHTITCVFLGAQESYGRS